MQTAIDVIRKIVIQNNLLLLNFNIYYPRGWKDGTLKHFKEEKDPDLKRDPARALEHTGPSEIFSLKHWYITGPKFLETINLRPIGAAVQILSPVMPGAEAAHIPMLDIEFAPKDENLSYLISCLRALGEAAGAILISGASYHYYGYNLLTPEAWRKFMYKSLLLDEVVDTRWVGHRLIDGQANLRITPKGEYNFIPYVVAEL